MRHVLIACALFLTGLFCGWLLFSGILLPVVATSKPLRLSQDTYPLINPLLTCSADTPKSTSQDAALNAVVASFIDGRKKQGLLDDMSVYLIDYKTGRWIGVNENDPYDPASMLKVPIMIAYYLAAEKDPKILSQEVSFNGDEQNDGEYFKSPNDIVAGRSYTISALINSMIVNSDNTAAILLQRYMGQSSLNEVYTDLGLSVPANAATVEYLSAKSYSYFFRVLYNATYLDRENSEAALELLTKPDIPGIRNGVPNGVLVAQKFGERTDQTSNGTVLERDLHDCGIVYKPGSPYLLCIMSKSKTSSFDTLAKNISDLSALVYNTI